MKILTYKIMGYTSVYNPETEEIEQKECPATVSVECHNQATYDANYPLAEAEAIPGTIKVTGEFDPDPPPTDSERIAELEEALDLFLSGVTE